MTGRLCSRGAREVLWFVSHVSLPEPAQQPPAEGHRATVALRILRRPRRYPRRRRQHLTTQVGVQFESRIEFESRIGSWKKATRSAHQLADAARMHARPLRRQHGPHAVTDQREGLVEAHLLPPALKRRDEPLHLQATTVPLNSFGSDRRTLRLGDKDRSARCLSSCWR